MRFFYLQTAKPPVMTLRHVSRAGLPDGYVTPEGTAYLASFWAS